MRRCFRPAARAIAFALLLPALSVSSRVVAQQGSGAAAPRGDVTAAQAAQSPAPDFRFTSGKAALKIPFELYADVIFLQARVNNSPPLWFLLDTGAGGTLINSSRTKGLGLKYLDAARMTGMGGSVKGDYLGGATFSLPGVEVFNRKIVSIPIDPLTSRVGRGVDGIIGYDFFKMFVVEIDYLNKTINLYDPRVYTYSGPGEVIPFTIRGGTPFTRITIGLAGHEPIQGEFELDTGADGALSINKPFAEAHRLLELLPRKSGTLMGAGAGGNSPYVSGRLASIQLGRFRFENPVVSFSQDTKGAGSSSASDGQLGTEVFRRFTVIFDYSRGRMMLEPNADFSAPFETDMSGLDLVAGGDDLRTFTVNDVEAGSPAAEAGLRAEDVLVAIDNRPAAGFNLDQITNMFCKEGKEYVLTIMRGRENLKVKLKLRRLI
ncbi:MAG: hypothetical protein QOJ76_960 [Acidobacteriota bacterium]|nr:hypothetical protein [Acidobacteriota bacterium]